MTDVLDVVGLVALVVAGFLVATWVGFVAVGVGCLALSFTVTAKERRAKEAEIARQVRLRQ